jgi:hypothetical protein
MARGPIFTNKTPWNIRDRLAQMYGKRSRSAASSLFPYLSTNSRAVAASLTRPQGSVAQRMYPHLPSSSAARMQQPKPRPRTTRARRIYGALE